MLVTDPRGYLYGVRQDMQSYQQKFLLNKEVTKIQKNPNNTYFVYVKDGTRYSAKHVLVSFSSGVLNAGTVKFEPELPNWKREALAMVPMCHYCKIFLKFDKQFWDNSTYFMLATKFRGKYMHWHNLANIYNESMLLATLTGHICKESHMYTDEEIKTQVYEVLRKVYKNATKPQGRYL